MAHEKTIFQHHEAIDKPEDLSVAVELKFLVPFRPRSHSGSKCATPRQPDLADFIETAQGLKDENRIRLWKYAYSIIADTIKTVTNQDALTSYDLESLRIEERDCWSTHWVVKRSMSAEPARSHAHCKDWLWVPVEVNSPKMPWKDPRTLARIRSAMDAIKARYIVVSNYTCEVHVHIGRMDGYPFSLTTLKKLAMLTWAAEPALRRVKDPRSPNFAHVYTWSNSARVYSRLASELGTGRLAHRSQPNDTMGLPQMLKEYLTKSHVTVNRDLNALRFIAETQSSVQLGKLLCGEGRPYRRLGFNFSAFGGEDERARTNPRTVECRFLEGTMDTDVVINWVQIFGRMTELSLDGAVGEDDRFSQIVLYRARDEGNGTAKDLTFLRLMRQLRLREDVCRPIQRLIQSIHGKT